VAITLTYATGATPLDPDEVAGLIPGAVTTTKELNTYEAENILAAIAWLESRRVDVLNEEFLKELHRRMFDKTWRWSGSYRQTEKNIGVDPINIAVAVRGLVLDVKAQVSAATLSLDEIAARFHHRLVSIHPFANGNGRHARLAADALLEQHGVKRFSWGAADLGSANSTRERYIEALREADKKNLARLIAFVRS
jgi:Fic-DOC domain mobile mystery protein B